MTTYQIGDQPTVTGLFTNLAGVPADPSAITVKVRKPDGTVSSYTQADCLNPAVGTWTFELVSPVDQDGAWRVLMRGTAGVVASAEIQFPVACSVFEGA